MSEMRVQLPDGAYLSVEQGITFEGIAEKIGTGLKKAALAAKVDGKLVDLKHTLTQSDVKIEFITPKTLEGLSVIRHTTAHLLAMAVQKLWPETQVTIGPVIEDGFYYDFSFPEGVKITEKEFEAIEKEMEAIVKANFPVRRVEASRQEMIERFAKMGETFKVELIRELPENEVISAYEMGDWVDLCRGPHVPATGKLGAFKLTAVAGAYWRGKEGNPMLTRIYGTAWGDKKELTEYLHNLEEAKKRDHRVLGKQLGLFSFHVEAPASPFFHPKGAFVYNSLMGYMRQINKKYGFEEVGTPLIMDVSMWKQSGHYDNYRENMYFTKVDETESAVKPMNCPGHCLIYSSDLRSYRDLPVRMSEFGRVHRHERSGVTHGLFRVRSFVQDDAHVYCRPDQINTEIKRILTLINEVYSFLGFEKYRVELSTRPEKSIGSDEVWQIAEQALQEVLEESGLEFKINPGDGAFYGPKIDFHLIDSLKRSWQCGTIQLDFSMPGRFNLTYRGADSKEHTPVMIHRAVLGSLERLFGILIEHYAGHFPLWCAPVQVQIIPVGENQLEYGEKVTAQLVQKGVRAELDRRNEKLGYKIREAQTNKVPYMLIVGDQEVTSGTVSLRAKTGEQTAGMKLDDVAARILAEAHYTI
jgi:threonyl-tRNA synthetase